MRAYNVYGNESNESKCVCIMYMEAKITKVNE